MARAQEKINLKPLFLKQIRFFSCVYIFLIYSIFPRHWTIARCLKHRCKNRCTLRQRNWDTLYIIAWFNAILHVQIYTAGRRKRGMDRKTWRINRWGRESISTRELIRRGGGNFTFIVQQLVKSTHSFPSLSTDFEYRLIKSGGSVRRGIGHISVLINHSIAAQYWCIV